VVQSVEQRAQREWITFLISERPSRVPGRVDGYLPIKPGNFGSLNSARAFSKDGRGNKFRRSFYWLINSCGSSAKWLRSLLTPLTSRCFFVIAGVVNLLTGDEHVSVSVCR
jgi:hypothetical protein